jgi:hypothetical protein
VPEIKEFQPTPGVNWTLAVIVYGIVGILDLFAGSLSSLAIKTFLNFYVESYLLVITSRLDVGHGEHLRFLHLDAKVRFVVQYLMRDTKSTSSKVSRLFLWVDFNKPYP